MSWLDEPHDTEYVYECPDKHKSVYVAKNTEQEAMRAARPCLEDGCEHQAEYKGFEWRSVGLITRVTYVQNGVKAVKVSDGKGGIQHISMRKLNYLESGGESTKAFYTKEKENQIRASGRTDLLEDRNPKKERAEAQRAKVERAKATEKATNIGGATS